MDLLKPFRRKAPEAPAVKAARDGVVGFRLDPSGRMEAIKAGDSYWTGGVYFNADQYLNNSATGLAFAFVVSVWAFRAVNVCADAIAGLRWRVVDKDSREELPDHPLARALRRNEQKLLRKWQWSLKLWGEVFVEKTRNRADYPAGLNWLNNLGVTVDASTGYIRKFMYSAPNGANYAEFDPHEMIFAHTDNPFDDLRGLSPFLTIMDELGIDRDVARVTRAFYANDARPGILLVPENAMSQADATRFMDTWKAQFQGPDKAGKPALLERKVSVIEVQRAPTLDDAGLRESVRREICAAFGVPLSLVDTGAEVTYENKLRDQQWFAESRVIPDGRDIAADINAQAMPFFDASGDAEFEFVFDEIKALSEDALRQTQLTTQRLGAGLITLNEARDAEGLEPLPAGNVLYLGGQPIPVAQLDQMPLAPASPAPPPIAAQATTNAPRLPAPKPKLLNPGNGNGRERAEWKPATVVREVTPRQKAQEPPQADIDGELVAWEKVALKSTKRAQDFECYVTPAETQAVVREALAELPAGAGKDGVRAIFDAVKKKAVEVEDIIGASPESYMAYWHDYDALMDEIGDAWLEAYMQRAWDRLRREGGRISDTDVMNALAGMHDELVDEWVGSEAQPGPLARVVYAGMAAANQSIITEEAADPSQPTKAFGLSVSWDLQSRRAREFVRNYAFSLIRNLDETTRNEVRAVIGQWVATGGTLDDLTGRLQRIFNDPKRARMIAQTESTRAYNEGALERYRSVGVTQAVWQTVKDQFVCPICRHLHGVVGDIEKGWEHPGGPGKAAKYRGQFFKPPAHPRCRCFTRAVKKSKQELTEQAQEPPAAPRTNRATPPGMGAEEKLLNLQSWYQGQRHAFEDREAGVANQFKDGDIIDQKAQIAHQIAQRTGIHAQVASDFVSQWAVSSNGDEWGSLSIQEMAAQQFGLELSPWQRERIEQVRARRNAALDELADHLEQFGPSRTFLRPGIGDNLSSLERTFTMRDIQELGEERVIEMLRNHQLPLKSGIEGFDDSASATNDLLRAMYEETREQLRRDGIDTVVLYRGVVLEAERADQIYELDFTDELPDTVGFQGNALESWTLRPEIAQRFAEGEIGKGEIGIVLQIEVPAERVLSTANSGFGCLSEWEAVVIGGEGDEALLAGVYERWDYMSEDALRPYLEKSTPERITRLLDRSPALRDRIQQLLSPEAYRWYMEVSDHSARAFNEATRGTGAFDAWRKQNA